MTKMNFDEFYRDDKPLDKLIYDGGFCGILRTIGCIGDSLASGEFETNDGQGNKTYHDFYEYSWGQFIARNIGSKVYNFSQGGMTTLTYTDGWADHWGFFRADKLCNAYIIALGQNDIKFEEGLGDISDIDLSDWRNNKRTFAGRYAQIIQRLQELSPRSKFFLMTIPRSPDDEQKTAIKDRHREILLEFEKMFPNIYLLDFRKYAPVYDEKFRENFYLGGHMNAAGYLLNARMVETYIDWIIRHNMKDFAQVGFWGTDFENIPEKQ